MSEIHQYVVKTCTVKFETDRGYATSKYWFEPEKGGIGDDDIMGLAKLVNMYLYLFCRWNLKDLDREGVLASPIVEIDCHTVPCGFDGVDFSIMCDYSFLFNGKSETFKAMLYVGDAYVGELAKYVTED